VELATTARTLASAVREHGTLRNRVARIQRALGPAPGPGAVDYLPERAGGGVMNPSAVPVVVYWDGDSSVTADVVFDPMFSGGEGQVHGSIVAGLFDDVLSHVITALGLPAVTGRLSVHYRSPTPTGVPVLFRGRLRSREGRHILIDGEARHGDTVTATAELLMVVVDSDRFSRHSKAI
jgi:acyl-coenzyme A thioesterase PaaI-like protein